MSAPGPFVPWNIGGDLGLVGWGGPSLRRRARWQRFAERLSELLHGPRPGRRAVRQAVASVLAQSESGRTTREDRP